MLNCARSVSFRSRAVSVHTGTRRQCKHSWNMFSARRLVHGGWRRVTRFSYYHTKNCYGHWNQSQNKQTTTLPTEEWIAARARDPNLWRLVTAYHEHGHKTAHTDPLGLQPRFYVPELSPEYYDLSPSNTHNTAGLLHCLDKSEAVLSDITGYLEQTYCGVMALETAQITDVREREWIIKRFEECKTSELPQERKQLLFQLMMESQVFDHFLAKKFGTFKRYGAEGAESMLGFFHECFTRASIEGISDIVLCMPHRGRLNLLTGLLDYPLPLFFHKINGNSELPPTTPPNITGDIAAHLVNSVDLEFSGRQLHVTMLPNPSHLEAANPVAMGKTRARLLSHRSVPYRENTETPKALLVQVHGDAAISAQGIVTEMFSLSNTPNFSTGGSVHLIVNNQVGFTTPVELGRSSQYCSDVSKMNGYPVIHVNGAHPEEVVKASQLAMDYCLTFQKDAIVVLNSFRKLGHNELDDPSFTQPLMYKAIKTTPSIPDSYCEQLKVPVNQRDEICESYYEKLNIALKQAVNVTPPVFHLLKQWKDMSLPTSSITTWETGVPVELLKYVGARSVTVPENFAVHDRLAKAHIESRLKQIKDGDKLDWATAEALAFGSLLLQGFNVRLSGQDVGRGTFSHRHAMLIDQNTDEAYISLNKLSDEQPAYLEVANSCLSEEAVLGFEYGFSIESPHHLVIWEAQFGDFFNTAQSIIDTFISSAEGKWLLQSGLVMLLPHGYDGAGPEHSSCRIERFLQMCDSSEAGADGDVVNMHVSHPTTPAQYFHLLRRQMVRNFRKPLIVASPKILLRLPQAVSSLQEMGPGSFFQPVLNDPVAKPENVTKIVFCSGKHYYALDAHRRRNEITNTAIIRLELLCPFPSGEIYSVLKKYPKVKEFLWSQEEPANMGAWSYVEPRFRRQLGHTLNLVSRKPLGPPAVGVSTAHQSEVKSLLLDTFPQVK